MILDRNKIELQMARLKMTRNDLGTAGLPIRTYYRIREGRNVKPATAGRIAEILRVDVAELVKGDA